MVQKKFSVLKAELRDGKKQRIIFDMSVAEKKLKNIFTQGAIPASFIADSIQKHSNKTGIGAHSIFLGQVRSDEISHRKVLAIEYTCYEAMALEKIQEIRENIFEKYELTCMHVHHSLGRVNAGEISLFVFTSAEHRKAAIEACNETVERIKKELPVWGKELLSSATRGEDANYKWKENR
jgi:molybdopterin synthase catalytic subunit